MSAPELPPVTAPEPHLRFALSRRTALILLLLLALQAGLLVVGARSLGCTVDEPNYFNAGHLIETRGFVHEVTVLQGPLALSANQWFTGAFPEGGLVRDPVDREALFRGRLGTLPFALLAALVLFLWARALFGERGALLVGTLFALDPLLLGYGSTLLVDVPHTALVLLTLFLTWAFLETRAARFLPWIGVAVGLALATKYLAVFLALPVGVLVALGAGRGTSSTFGLRLGRAAAALATVVACAFAALHLAYGLREGLGSTRVEDYASDLLRDWVGRPGLGRLAVLFPAPFLRGIDFQQVQTDRSWSPYLNGLFAPGHPTSYLWALASKLPEVVLACAGLAAFRALRLLKRGARPPGWASAALACGAYGALELGFLSLATNMQLGIRYALPIVPLILLVCGALVFQPAVRVRAGAAGAIGGRFLLLLLLLGAAHAVELVGSAPDWIAYYNRAAGGQRLAYRRFIDSSSDFGQYEIPGPALLRARHPDVQILGPYSGPRFGTLAIDAVALRTQDPEQPERSRFHWLIDGPSALDHLAASWWVFEVTPEALEERVAADDDPGLRRDLAVAYLGAGRRAHAQRHLRTLDGERAAPLKRLIAAQDAFGPRATPQQFSALVKAWRVVGRPDVAEALAAAHPELAQQSDVALYGDVQALEERREYLAAKDLAISRGRTIDPVLFRLYLDLGRVGAHAAADQLFGAIEQRAEGVPERGLYQQVRDEQQRRRALLELLR